MSRISFILIAACAGLTAPFTWCAPLPDTSACESYICIEADSGIVLAEALADVRRPAASMVKMMMMLLVSEGLQAGSWTLDTEITVSRHAESMGGSQVYLQAGETVTLGRLMYAVAVASANDAAMAVAEGLWGSEEAYLKRMNERAQELGMIDSEFHTVHGLPPSTGKDADQTTARDMAILAQWVVRHKRVMEWTGTRELVFREGEAAKFNTNKLLWRMEECDGLKTGYTSAAGFCLAATAERGGARLIAVVMGCASANPRFAMAGDLLEYGFSQVRRLRVIAKGGGIDTLVPVKNYESGSVQLHAADDLWVVVKEDDAERIVLVPELFAPLQAPIAANTVVGQALAELDGRAIARVNLMVPEDLEAAGWRWKLKNAVLGRLGSSS